MKISSDKTKIANFRRAGATGKRMLHIRGKPIEFVSSFRYSGVTLQLALGFHEHVENLVTRSAVIVACLGSVQRLSLETAETIYDLKIMLVVTV